MSTAPPGANRDRAAFTLLELLAVITLVAVLAGLMLGAGRRAADSGRTARAKAELAALAAALEDYRRVHGDYPQTDDAARLLQSLIGRLNPLGIATAGRALIEPVRFAIARPDAPTVSRDPYSDDTARLMDPWGRSYRYAYKVPAEDWNNHSYILYSAGPDGRDAAAFLPGGFIDADRPENADNIHPEPSR